MPSAQTIRKSVFHSNQKESVLCSNITLRPDEYAFYGVTGSGAALRAEPLDG